MFHRKFVIQYLRALLDFFCSRMVVVRAVQPSFRNALRKADKLLCDTFTGLVERDTQDEL